MIELPCADRPRLSIIIPTTSPERLRVAIASIAADSGSGVAFETIVVANGADQALTSALETVSTGVRVIRSPVQLGVAGGYNLGRRSARGDLIVLMHDDVEVEPGWLQAWIDATDAHPEAGVFGSKVLFPDGSLRGAGNILWQDGRTSPPWRGEAPGADAFDTPRPVDYTASCSALVRASTWDAIGGLDEEFYPAYYIDVDLAMSARRHGWSVLYWPTSRIRHHAHGGGGRRRREFVSERNRERFVQRWKAELELQPAVGSDIDDAIGSAARRVPVMSSDPIDANRSASTEVDHVRLASALDRAYIDHLEQVLDACTAQVAALQAQRAHWYQLGSRIEFGERGSGAQFASSGGYPAEDWGLWVGDRSFVVELPLGPLDADIATPQPTILELEAVHHLCELRQRSLMAVEVDGVHVLDVDESRDGVVRHSAPIPAGVVAGRSRIVTVTLRPSGAVSPLAAGRSADGRALAVGLVSMTLS